MPRRARPWYRRARSMWFATLDGKQLPLGITDPNDPAGAEAAWQQLLAAADRLKQIRGPGAPESDDAGGVARSTDRAVLDFLASAATRAGAGKIKKATLSNYALALGPLAAAFGSRPIASLTPEEVEGWADRPAWSPSTRNTYLGTVQTLLRWCRLPLKVRRPPKESRGADTVLTDEQFASVLREAKRYKGAKGDLCELLTVLRETGARPGEVSGLCVERVDWDAGCTRLKEHKTRRHTGADRVIHFTAAALAVLNAQREKYGTGLLFRTRAGLAYRPAAIVRRLGRVSRRLGFRVIAYGLGRHSFCTRALSAGIPDVVVAALMGHVGTGMIHRHYSHVGQNAKLMKEAAEKVSGTREAG